MDKSYDLEAILSSLSTEVMVKFVTHMATVALDHSAELARTMGKDELERSLSCGAFVRESKRSFEEIFEQEALQWLRNNGYISKDV